MAPLLEKFSNNGEAMVVFRNEGRAVAAEAVVQSRLMALTRTDSDIVEIVVREHARLVYRIAHCVLKNAEDAEDATQETFLRVLRYGKKLEQIENMKAWIARIAWRTAVARKIKHTAPLPDESVAIDRLQSSDHSAEQSLQEQQTAAAVSRLIRALPAELRDALTLSALEEMTPAEVAHVLDCSEAAVRSRIFRARQILKTRLAALVGKRDEL